MNRLTANQDAKWLRVNRRRVARDGARTREAALTGRLGLYDSLIAALAGRPDIELTEWRAELHSRIAGELQQLRGIVLVRQFLTAAHTTALRDFQAGQ